MARVFCFMMIGFLDIAAMFFAVAAIFLGMQGHVGFALYGGLYSVIFLVMSRGALSLLYDILSPANHYGE